MELQTLAELVGAHAVGYVTVDLPKAGTSHVPVFRRSEFRATSPVPRTASCWAPNKPSLEFNGKSTWAELVLVELLDAAGWEARWIKNWGGGREFCRRAGMAKPYSAEVATRFAAIHRLAPELKGAGSWDVFAHRGGDYLCIESKQARSSDRLRATQLAWMDAAIESGLSAESFVIVEYDTRPVAA